MVAHVQTFKTSTILGSPSSDNLVGSFVHQIGVGEDPGSAFGIGVRWTIGAFEPQLLILPPDDGGLVLVGFDTEIVALSWSALVTDFRIEFESYFRSMFFLKGVGILAVEEIGVSLISLAGEKLWGVVRDVLTEVRLDRNRALYLSFMDSPSLTIDLESGLPRP